MKTEYEKIKVLRSTVLFQDERDIETRKEPSVVELLTEIRDELRAMRKVAEGNKYETKTDKREIRYKGQFENTGAMEVPETK